jgi:hypothetical protein
MSDMHIYPFVFFALLIVLYYIPVDKRRITAILLVLYFVGFAFSDAEKIYWQNESSGYVREFQDAAYELIGENPAGVYVIFPDQSLVERGNHYGGFANDWCVANLGGVSLYAVYGYDMLLSSAVYTSADDIYALTRAAPQNYTTLVVYADKTMSIER